MEQSIQPDAESAACLTRGALEMIRIEFEAQTWEAFRRGTVGGEPPASVATDLGVSVPAVYKAESRVLGRFREVFSEFPQ